jgi:hypothetical protein
MATKIKLVHRIGGSLDLLDLGACQGWSLDQLRTFPDEDSASETWFYRTPDGCWIVEVADLCYETSPMILVRKLIDEMSDIPDELQADVAAALSGPSVSQSPPNCSPIELGGPNEPVNVINRQLPPLSRPRYEVLRPLVEAYPLGLTEDELKTESRREGCVSIYKGMRKNEPALAQVLALPGRRGRGGYRLEWPGAWRG